MKREYLKWLLLATVIGIIDVLQTHYYVVIMGIGEEKNPLSAMIIHNLPVAILFRVATLVGLGSLGYYFSIKRGTYNTALETLKIGTIIYAILVIIMIIMGEVIVHAVLH